MIIIKQPKKTAQTYENKYVRFFYKNKCEKSVDVSEDFTPLWIIRFCPIKFVLQIYEFDVFPK